MYKQVLQGNQAKCPCRKPAEFYGCSALVVGGRREEGIKGDIKASGVKCQVQSSSVHKAPLIQADYIVAGTTVPGARCK